MRFWNRLSRSPNRGAHSRSDQTRATSATAFSFGQRPLFSRSDDEDVTPTAGELPFENTLDALVPTDLSKGNADSDLVADLPSTTMVRYSGRNVTSTPTAADFNSAFGSLNKVKGFIGVLADAGGNPMYTVASNGTDWYYVRMTKAV